MTHKTLLLGLWLLVATTALAQNAAPTVIAPDSLRQKLDLVFANLDKTPITSGFLEEYGVPLIPLDIFNGVLTDSNRVDMTVWRQVYSTLYTARIQGTNPMATLPVVNSALTNAEAANTASIPVTLLYGEYHALRPDAITANLLTVQQAQLFDVPGRTQSPYLLRKLFAPAPLRSYAEDGVISLVFTPELFYNISTKTLSNIKVDFGDGRGYLVAAWNTALNASFSTTGTKRIKVQLTFSDNSVMQSYIAIDLISTSIVPFSYTNPADLTVNFAATAAHAGGTVSVRYSRQGTERSITKPLIIIEGYDVSSIASKLSRNYNYRDITNALNVNFNSGTNFSDQLDNIAGYDLIFIDYRNGTDDIRRNAALFQDVVTWVNTQKANAGSSQQNVVIGISMGGLVARYGLANMTKQGMATQTRLLLTHDSPHRGANTPIGFQSLTLALNEVQLVRLINLFDLLPELEQARALLQAPASQQMLIMRATNGTGGFAANTFLDTDYRNMITFTGSVQPSYQTIATSLGSQCGIGSLTAGSELLRIQGRFFISPIPWIRRSSLNTEVIVNAVSASGPARVSKLRLWVNSRILGFININVNLTNKSASSPSGMLPWDGAPGGTQNVRDQGASKFPTLQVRFLPFLDLSLQATFAGDFCFIPAVSALDITNLNASALSASYVSGYTPPSNPSRMNTFIAQESFTRNSALTYNQVHPVFTPRQSDWIYRSLENLPGNTLNCSNECAPNYTPTLSGPTTVCGSNTTYTLSNVPAGVTITWSTSSNITAVSGQGTLNYTVKANATGSGSVSATLSNGCSAPYTKTLSGLTVNTVPNPTFISTTYVYCYEQKFETNAAPGSIYTWTYYQYPNGAPVQLVGRPYSIKLALGGGSYRLGVNSSCNTSVSIFTDFVVDCSDGGGPRFSISPNPSSELITIASTTSERETTSDPMMAKLFDLEGRLLVTRQQQLREQNLTVDVSQIPNGTYILHIIRKQTVTQHHVVVNHQTGQ